MQQQAPHLFSSPLIKRAFYFAAQCHDGQYRKGIKVPYFAHPALVALGVSEFSGDEEVIAAAVLHDVLEDCDVLPEELREEFGIKISTIVKDLSCPELNAESTWKLKKELYVKHLEQAGKDALLIVAVDKTCNMLSYLEGIGSLPADAMSNLFKGNPADYIWYYGAILSLLTSKLPGARAVNHYKNVFSEFTRNIEK